MTPTIITAISIGGLGFACAFALTLAAKFLAVEEDPRIEKLTDMLPGANCGGCAYAGCADYAKAIVLDSAKVNMCAPGGPNTLAAISTFMGVEAEAGERNVAIVLCGGNSTNAPRQSLYNGVADCTAANSTAGGDKTCTYGCLGYGSCARACPVDAIEIKNGLAIVHPELCIGCSACVKTCPRHIIKMVPENKTIHVLCNSHAKGPIVKKACSVGCIGCTICTKLAENEAIKMDKFLAIVDYTKDLDSDKVIEKCPGKCIVRIGASSTPNTEPEEPQKVTG
ncbi:MAG: RnfABCDGE type electron transport complex subunit B [Kiritimatiellae bacterium]|nr:RnfABCDGE type electron transport complex subunit B [Kiritimatiellia bacterium]